MTVYKRGNKWCFHFEMRVNGKREQYKRGGFDSRQAAAAAERRKLSEIDGGARIGAARMTVEDYLRGWLRRYERSGSRKRGTVVTTRGQVELHLLPRIGGVTLSKLSRVKVQELVGDLHTEAGLSAKTVRNVIGTLNKALNDAVADGVLPYSPAAKVDLPKVKKPELATWSPLQVSCFLKFADDERQPLAAAWWLVLTAGLRRGELCGLRWSDIDLLRGQVTVRKTRLQNRSGVWLDEPKSRKSRRTRTLHAGAVNALARLKNAHEELAAVVGDFGHDFVLVMPDDGRPVQPQYVTRWWHRSIAAANRAGLQLASIELPTMRLHDGRHVCFTHAAEAGTPLHVIAAQAGHESIVTTERFYLHATEAADAAATQRHEQYLQQALRDA